MCTTGVDVTNSETECIFRVILKQSKADAETSMPVGEVRQPKKAKLAIVDSLQGGRGLGGKTVRYTDDLVRAVFVACRYFLRDTPLL